MATIQIVQPKPNLLTDSESTRSPLKNSPRPKKSRRRRTGLELTVWSSLWDHYFGITTHYTQSIRMRDGQVAPPLEISLREQVKTPPNVLQNIPAPETSNIIYYKVLDQKCDNKETLLSIINDLYTTFILSSLWPAMNRLWGWVWLMVNRHFLKNLLKVYFEAEAASKYLPKSIGTNSHELSVGVSIPSECLWVSAYELLFSEIRGTRKLFDWHDDVSYMMTNSPPSELQDSALRNLKEMLEEITDKAKNMTNFSTFIDTHAKENQTLQFWCQFLLQDCLAYIALFLAIRSGNWELRVGAHGTSFHKFW